jgi:hypothetical protein
VCVLAGFVPFCFAAAFASVLVYFKPGCIVIAIGAAESKISRFVSAREHGLCLALLYLALLYLALLGVEWSGVDWSVEPLAQPIRYGVESRTGILGFSALVCTDSSESLLV